ncbi:hypothetical protein AYO20_05856 [Fonsecaea nubica]|uniref:Uncharacterized protein n=1 Tax=Fonsecaea nubica TaxID=856822 RepID=A0A178D189_9EURO|nr:hypothetical protein AYO20_05856 [Fonsecaea nubica]OAL34895.1 hypothetical protein AYO20_05856 [Fonsecaea nubica]
MASPCFTKVYRTTTYPAIEPSRPELSTKDKTVVVAGAGEGNLVAAVALSFAKAGAQKIALTGATEETLEKTKAAINQSFPDVTVLVTPADLSKANEVGLAAHTIRSDLGAWDVFVNCAGYSPTSTTLAGADEDDWWQAFEINTKFSAHFAKHFLPKCRANATYVDVNAAACHRRASQSPKDSAYLASQLAAAKLDEYLAEENPKLRVFTVYPGDTSSSSTSAEGLELAAHFTVWLASPEADFLKSGRVVGANWDVEELVARKVEIEADPTLFRVTIGGWPPTR